MQKAKRAARSPSGIIKGIAKSSQILNWNNVIPLWNNKAGSGSSAIAQAAIIYTMCVAFLTAFLQSLTIVFLNQSAI